MERIEILGNEIKSDNTLFVLTTVWTGKGINGVESETYLIVPIKSGCCAMNE